MTESATGRTADTERRPRQWRRSTRNRPTDQHLVDATLGVLAEFGERATMERIAEAANTTKATLYAHYGSRENLLSATLDRELDTITAWMFEAYDRADGLRPRERTRMAVEALFGYAEKRPDGFRALLSNRQGQGLVTGADRDSGRHVMTALEPRIAERFRLHYRDRSGSTLGASADVLASLVLGITLNVAHEAIIVAGASPDAACALAVTATLGALDAVAPEHLSSVDESVVTAPPTSP